LQAKTRSGCHFDPDALTAREAVIIGAGFLVICFAYSILGHEAYVKWGGMTLDTAAIFGYFLHDSRRYFRVSRFWKLTSILLIVHLVAWIVLLMHVEKWGLPGFIIMVLELPAFWHLRDRPGLLD
jgi:hypothetical protein